MHCADSPEKRRPKGREERHLSKSLLRGVKEDFMKAGGIMPPSTILAVPGHSPSLAMLR